VAYCVICFVARVSVTVIQCRPGVEQFPVPGSRQLFVVAIYACAFTCGRSFTVRSG